MKRGRMRYSDEADGSTSPGARWCTAEGGASWTRVYSHLKERAAISVEVYTIFGTCSLLYLASIQSRNWSKVKPIYALFKDLDQTNISSIPVNTSQFLFITYSKYTVQWNIFLVGFLLVCWKPYITLLPCWCSIACWPPSTSLTMDNLIQPHCRTLCSPFKRAVSKKGPHVNNLGWLIGLFLNTDDFPVTQPTADICGEITSCHIPFGKKTLWVPSSCSRRTEPPCENSTHSIPIWLHSFFYFLSFVL